MADRPAAQAASVVLAAIRPIPSKSIAESVLPGLKPYQPNHRMKPPTVAIVRSCGSIGPPPSRLNRRPMRGPSTIAPARATKPPMLWTTVEPAKSWKLVPKRGEEVAFAPHRRQPAVGAPRPVTEDRVDEARHADAVDDIAEESGSSDHRARRDGRARVGERVLEEPEREERDATRAVRRRGALEEEVLGAEEGSPGAEHEREAPGVEEQTTETRVDHALQQHVHRLAGARETGFQHGEAGLYPEDEEGRDERPDGVDRVDDVVALDHDVVRLGRTPEDVRQQRDEAEQHGDAERLATEQQVAVATPL